MTNLEAAIKKREISFYSLIKAMGLNPHHYQGVWAEKVKGKRSMSNRDLDLLQSALKELGKEEMSQEELNIELKRFFVK